MRFARLAMLLVLYRAPDIDGTQICQLDSLIDTPAPAPVFTMHVSHCVPDRVFAQGFQ